MGAAKQGFFRWYWTLLNETFGPGASARFAAAPRAGRPDETTSEPAHVALPPAFLRDVTVTRNLHAQIQSVARLNTPAGRKPRTGSATASSVKERPVRADAEPKRLPKRKQVWIASRPKQVALPANVVPLPVADRSQAPRTPSQGRTPIAA